LAGPRTLATTTAMETLPPQPDEELERLGLTAEFAGELRRLAELAPTKALADKLLRLAEGESEE
jgi:hypothetical protein